MTDLAFTVFGWMLYDSIIFGLFCFAKCKIPVPCSLSFQTFIPSLQNQSRSEDRMFAKEHKEIGQGNE